MRNGWLVGVSAGIVLVALASCESHPNIHLDLGTPPDVPSALTATAGPGQVVLHWLPDQSSDNVTRYVAYGASVPWTTWNPSLPSATRQETTVCCSATVSSLSNDQTYWFAIAAVNSHGESAMSSQVHARPPGWSLVHIGTPAADGVSGMSVASDESIYLTGATDGTFPGETSAGASDVFVGRLDPSGKTLWVKQFGSPLVEGVNGIALDADNDAIVVGTTYGTLPGEAAAGGRDMFLAKYAPDGTRKWITQRGTTGDEEALAVAVYGTANIYVAGMTAGGFDGNVNAGSFDFFLMKFDGNGTHVWTRQIGGTMADYGNSLVVDSIGDVFVGGETYGNFDGHINAGNIDSWVAHYLPDGTKMWLQMFGTSGFDRQTGIGVDDVGGVYVGGDTDGALNGEINSGSGDAYVCRFLMASGTLDFTRLIGGPGSEALTGLRVGPGPRIFITGQTPAPVSNPNLDTDLFLTYLDGFGNRGWTRVLGTTDYDAGGVALVGENPLVSIGTSAPYRGVPSHGATDAYITRFDKDGNEQ
jgi:hypothetical protein